MPTSLSPLLLLLLLAVAERARAATVQVTVGSAGNSRTFSPASVTINTGDTVEWVWAGTLGHNVIQKDAAGNSASACNARTNGGFASHTCTGSCGTSSAAFSFSHTFNTPGVFYYECTPHCIGGMVGVVNVAAAAGTTGGLTTGSTTAALTTTNAATTGALGATVQVMVGSVGNTFSPASISINAGDTVEWTWAGSSSHDVVQKNVPGNSPSACNDVTAGGFASASSSAPFSFSHTFNTPGVFYYECTPHCLAGMVGVVNVGAGTLTTGTTTGSTTALAPGASTTGVGATTGVDYAFTRSYAFCKTFSSASVQLFWNAPAGGTIQLGVRHTGSLPSDGLASERLARLRP
jgi:plastocyanin